MAINYSAQERAILAEYIRRVKRCTSPVDFLDGLFDKQLAVVNDPSQRVCCVCSRRAGKTYFVIRMMMHICYSTPNARVAYCTDTRDHAEELVWGSLNDLNDQYNLGLYTHDTKLLMRFPNGSQLRLYGLEKTNQKEKLRGPAYHGVFVDEAQSLPDSVIQGTLKEVLGAAMKDYDGKIYVCGTPNETCSGYLHDIATKDDSPYSRHQWTIADNIKYPRWAGKENWREIAAQLIPEFAKEDGYLSEKEPGYQREYLGLWARSDDDFIYKLNDASLYDGNYPFLSNKVLGIDLGYRDEAAWVVVGYDQWDQCCYEVDSTAKAGLDMTGIMEITSRIIEQYEPERVVIDWASGGHHLIEELRTRYKINCTSAEKTKKAAYMRVANAELRTGKAVLLRDGKLREQMDALRWDSRYQREEEGQECDRHDAWLYAWREAKHYNKRELDKTSEEDKLWVDNSSRTRGI